MKYTNEIVINKPIELAIGFFDDAEDMYEWVESLVGHEVYSREVEQDNAKRTLSFDRGKNIFKMTETVLECNLPGMFAGKHESSFSNNIVRNQFVSLPDGKTKMISETTVQANKFMVRLMSWIMPGSFKKQSLKYLQSFKEFAERQEN